MSVQPGESASTPAAFSGRTAWARNLAAPVRDFLSTEAAGAVVLLCATVAALVARARLRLRQELQLPEAADGCRDRS